MSGFSTESLLLLLGSALAHVIFLLTTGGLPRWAGAAVCLAYGWFVWAGLAG